jgi:hypothetical protein
MDATNHTGEGDIQFYDGWYKDENGAIVKHYITPWFSDEMEEAIELTPIPPVYLKAFKEE